MTIPNSKKRLFEGITEEDFRYKQQRKEENLLSRLIFHPDLNRGFFFPCLEFTVILQCLRVNRQLCNDLLGEMQTIECKDYRNLPIRTFHNLKELILNITPRSILLNDSTRFPLLQSISFHSIKRKCESIILGPDIYFTKAQFCGHSPQIFFNASRLTQLRLSKFFDRTSVAQLFQACYNSSTLTTLDVLSCSISSTHIELIRYLPNLQSLCLNVRLLDKFNVVEDKIVLHNHFLTNVEVSISYRDKERSLWILYPDSLKRLSCGNINTIIFGEDEKEQQQLLNVTTLRISTESDEILPLKILKNTSLSPLSFPSLKQFSLSVYNPDPAALILLSFLYLQEINITVNEEILSVTIKNCPQLHTLSILGGFLKCAENVPSLRRFIMFDEKTTNASYTGSFSKHVVPYVQLEHLTLALNLEAEEEEEEEEEVVMQYVYLSHFKVICSLVKNLKTLEINFENNDEESDFKQMTKLMTYLQCLPSLTHLTLIDLDAHTIPIQNLYQLQIIVFCRVSFSSLLMTSLPSLTDVDISFNFSNTTDMSPHTLTLLNLPSLSRVHLNSEKATFSSQPLHCTFSQLPMLECLNLPDRAKYRDCLQLSISNVPLHFIQQLHYKLEKHVILEPSDVSEWMKDPKISL